MEEQDRWPREARGPCFRTQSTLRSTRKRCTPSSPTPTTACCDGKDADAAACSERAANAA
eukprot:2572255-Rhodomonas_salina.1